MGMRDLCMHIIDLVQNCVDADSTEVRLTLEENLLDNILRLTIEDNGRGIPPDILARLTDPFTTTRTTRKVGLGTSLMDMVCEQAGGKLTITSQVGVGTKLVAVMQHDHLDRPPVGDLTSTVKLMVLMYSDKINLIFKYSYNDREFDLSTAELKDALGGDVDLSEPEVVNWLEEYLKENIKVLKEAL